MHHVFSLTVSESKRLIAKGVAAADYVRRAMKEGTLAVGSGSTNGYVVEEIAGAAIGTVVARRIVYLHPVGLEKSTSADLSEVAERLAADPAGKGPALWVVPGIIFTEIEALHVLTGVEAVPAAAGGIGGAEGAVWLAAFGTPAQLQATQDLLTSLRAEPAFTSA